MLFFQLGLSAQVTLNGSIENTSTLVAGSGPTDFNNASQLKLLLNYNNDGVWRFFSDIRISAFYGYDGILGSGFSVVDKNGNYALGLDISRLYVKANFNSASFTLGRDYLSFGTPFLFNTLEWHKNFSLLDPTQAKPAINLVSLTLPVGSYGKFQSFLGGDNSWDDVLSGSELVLGTSGFEGGLVYQYKGDNENVIGAFFKADIFISIGGSYSFHLNNALVNTEKKDYSHEAAVFLDYSFPIGYSSLVVNQSFYYNSLGASSVEDLATTSYGDYFFRSMLYSYSSLSLALDEFTAIGIDVLVSMIDASGSVIPKVQYTLLDNMIIELASGIYFGKENTEFSPKQPFIPNASVSLALKAKF